MSLMQSGEPGPQFNDKDKIPPVLCQLEEWSRLKKMDSEPASSLSLCVALHT